MDTLKKLTALELEATGFGFKWETAQQIMAQIQSEIHEIDVHLKDQNKHKLQEEIGDLLHAVFSLCVFCKLDPQKTLENSVDKFALRFRAVKELAAKQGLTSLNGKSFTDLMVFWNEAKKITE